MQDVHVKQYNVNLFNLEESLFTSNELIKINYLSSKKNQKNLFLFF